MKKVGIVTFHRPNNYGANLQAYALQEFINKQGYDANIIDYRNDEIEKSNKIIKLNSGIKNFIKTIIFSIKNVKKKKNFEKFRANNYKLTKVYYNKSQLEKNEEKFDVYVSGSDQIWNTQITKKIDDIYTLNFDTGIARKISYASSIGNGDMKKEEIQLLAERVKKYNSIAVREERAKNILEEYIDNDIKVVVDPTILLTKDEWKKVSNRNITKNIKEDYILLYTIIENEETFKVVNKISELTGLKIITLRRTNLKTNNVLKNCYTKGPDSYIELVKNAKYIVTSSFHGTVFSIIFNKMFFVNYGGKENKRVDNLLSICKLQDRLIKSSKDLDNIKLKKEINYEQVNDIINKERERAREYLKIAIEGKLI